MDTLPVYGSTSDIGTKECRQLEKECVGRYLGDYWNGGANIGGGLNRKIRCANEFLQCMKIFKKAYEISGQK